jgi:small subunit ribosomal protein S16
MGSRQDPHYRLVVSDSRSTPGGSFLDDVGYYNPGTQPATVKIDMVKADDWMRKGAHPSDTVRSLIEKAKALQT